MSKLNFSPQKIMFLNSLCKQLLQALAAVGFTDSASWLYLKSVMTDVSYHNYQETSGCQENSLVSSPQHLWSNFNISQHVKLSMIIEWANVLRFFDMGRCLIVLYFRGYKLTLKINLQQMTLYGQITSLKTEYFNVNFYQG